MSKTVTDRSEILFVYEAKDCNPNGDPLEENRPRIDPVTGVATVSDVRIKRTVRDYLRDVLEEEILIRDTWSGEGFLRQGKERAADFLEEAGVTKSDSVGAMVGKVREVILSRCIDARLFGTTLPVEQGKKKGGSVQLTGPVQFAGFNRSLHRVAPVFVQGTAAFASKAKSIQKSFREDYLLPYACIAAYGVVNEVAARSTSLTDGDVDKLLTALWKGTQGLISRSKMGHQPLFLLHLRYADGHRIGDLAGRLKLRSKLPDESLRNVSEYELDVTGLLDAATSASGDGHILGLASIQDPRLKLSDGEETSCFAELGRVCKLGHQKLVV